MSNGLWGKLVMHVKWSIIKSNCHINACGNLSPTELMLCQLLCMRGMVVVERWGIQAHQMSFISFLFWPLLYIVYTWKIDKNLMKRAFSWHGILRFPLLLAFFWNRLLTLCFNSQHKLLAELVFKTARNSSFKRHPTLQRSSSTKLFL